MIQGGQLTSKELLGQLGFYPCRMVQHAVSFVGGLGGPAKLGLPARLAPIGALLHNGLPVRERLPIFTFSNFDGAGFGGWWEVDISLRTVVDVRHNSHAFVFVGEALWNCLSRVNTCKQATRGGQWRRGAGTYSSGLSSLLFRAGIGVEGERCYASFSAVLDNLALGILCGDIAAGVAGGLDSALLFELVGGLRSRHLAEQSTLLLQLQLFCGLSIGSTAMLAAL